MSSAVLDLKESLVSRLEAAVLAGTRDIMNIEGRRVPVEEQERYTERLCACTVTILGQNWLGNLTLLVPMTATQQMVMTRKGIKPGERVHGGDMAELLGNTAAAVALKFGSSFLDDESLTVSMPIVAMGTDLAVLFPWGKNFESRLCFKATETPFWAILRLSLHGES